MLEIRVSPIMQLHDKSLWDQVNNSMVDVVTEMMNMAYGCDYGDQTNCNPL